MESTTIEDIDDELWRKFKAEAAREGNKVSEHLEQILRERYD